MQQQQMQGQQQPQQMMMQQGQMRGGMQQQQFQQRQQQFAMQQVTIAIIILIYTILIVFVLAINNRAHRPLCSTVEPDFPLFDIEGLKSIFASCFLTAAAAANADAARRRSAGSSIQ